MKSNKIVQACVEQRLLHKGNNILNRIDRLCQLNQLKQLATFHCNHMFQSEVGDSLKAIFFKKGPMFDEGALFLHCLYFFVT